MGHGRVAASVRFARKQSGSSAKCHSRDMEINNVWNFNVIFTVNSCQRPAREVRFCRPEHWSHPTSLQMGSDRKPWVTHRWFVGNWEKSLWSFAHVVRRDYVNRARNPDQVARACERCVYSIVKITRLYDYKTWQKHFFFRNHEVHKGL